MSKTKSNNPAEPEAVKCWTTAPNMILILYITNYYSCIRSIKFSQLYLGFLFTVVFGLTLPALLQQHKPETVTVLHIA